MELEKIPLRLDGFECWFFSLIVTGSFVVRLKFLGDPPPARLYNQSTFFPNPNTSDISSQVTATPNPLTPIPINH